MAVPAGDKARFFALQQGGFVDDVLEDFVERMAHVQGPIGVGGAVVEGEALAGVVLAEPLVELGLGPKSLELGLTHLGVGPHVERRLQQVQRVLVVGRSGGGACGHVAWGIKRGLSRLVVVCCLDQGLHLHQRAHHHGGDLRWGRLWPDPALGGGFGLS